MDNAIKRYIYGDSKAHTKFKYLNNFAISVSLIILNYHKLCFISLYYNPSTHSFSFCFVMCFSTLALFYFSFFFSFLYLTSSFVLLLLSSGFFVQFVHVRARACVCVFASSPLLYHHVCCSLAQSVDWSHQAHTHR